jgi:hypothetical protein
VFDALSPEETANAVRNPETFLQTLGASRSVPQKMRWLIAQLRPQLERALDEWSPRIAWDDFTTVLLQLGSQVQRLQELVDDAARPPAQKLDELIRETVEKDPSAAKQARGGGALFPFPPLLFCPRISRAFLTTCFFLIVTIADGHREATQRIRAER